MKELDKTNKPWMRVLWCCSLYKTFWNFSKNYNNCWRGMRHSIQIFVCTTDKQPKMLLLIHLILHLVHLLWRNLFTVIIFIFNVVCYLICCSFIIMVIKFEKNTLICTLHKGKSMMRTWELNSNSNHIKKLIVCKWYFSRRAVRSLVQKLSKNGEN